MFNKSKNNKTSEPDIRRKVLGENPKGDFINNRIKGNKRNGKADHSWFNDVKK